MSSTINKRDSSDNEMLRYIYDLYDIIYDINYGSEKPQSKRLWKISIENISWDKVNYYERLENQYKKVLEYADRLGRVAPSFSTLWDFCEFIRISEKSFFYHNSPEKYVYAEMDMEKPNEPRKLCISKYINREMEYEIRLTLEHFVYDSDMITIEVVRGYGRNMKNTYKVVDGNLPFDDSSDAYLINEINAKLQEAIKTTFLSVAEHILKDGGVTYYGI